MNHRLAWAALAALACVSTGDALIAASTYAARDVDIVVDGTARTRYVHEGRWYVEALKGKEYAIRLHNPYGVRVAIALSVDGLNTIDARDTTAHEARKWVLDPYETVTISGWQTSQTSARRFEFTTEERSYGQALGKTANLGIISAVFFKERPRPVRAYERDQNTTDSESPSSPPPAAQSAAGATANRKAPTSTPQPGWDDEPASKPPATRIVMVSRMSSRARQAPARHTSIRAGTDGR